LLLKRRRFVLHAAASRVLNNTQAGSGNARKRPSQSLTKLAQSQRETAWRRGTPRAIRAALHQDQRR
jgi:hypothetical protein